MRQFGPARGAIVCSRVRWGGGKGLKDKGEEGRREGEQWRKLTKDDILTAVREMTPAQSSLLACPAEKTRPPGETHASALLQEKGKGEGKARRERMGGGVRREKKDVCMCVWLYVCVLGDGVEAVVFRTADMFSLHLICRAGELTKCFRFICCPSAWTHSSIQQTVWSRAEQKRRGQLWLLKCQ